MIVCCGTVFLMIGKILKSFISSGPKGLIQLYGLENWYLSLDDDTREKVKSYYSLGMNCDSKRVDQGDLVSFNPMYKGCQNFLCNVGTNAISKDPSFAEMVLLKALLAQDDNPLNRHFVYNRLIDLYYKQREKRSDAIDLCIKYCIEDIKRIEAFKLAYIKEYEDIQNQLISRGQKKIEDKFEVDLPGIPSFDRLRIIYEKQGKHREAIQVCSKAIEVGAWDIEAGNEQISKLMKKIKAAER